MLRHAVTLSADDMMGMGLVSERSRVIRTGSGHCVNVIVVCACATHTHIRRMYSIGVVVVGLDVCLHIYMREECDVCV